MGLKMHVMEEHKRVMVPEQRKQATTLTVSERMIEAT